MKKKLYIRNIINKNLKNLLILILAIGLFSCDEEKKYFFSNPIKLRQLVKETVKETHSSGSFFLIAGGYSSSESQHTTVKVFGRVGGLYRFMEMDMDEIRINIDNKLTEPNIVVRYFNVKELPLNRVLEESYYYHLTYIINCPEKYLPEKLLPIEL